MLPVGKHIYRVLCYSPEQFFHSSQVDTMSFRKYIDPCERFIAGGDTHDRCVQCLGLKHPQVALNSLSDCRHSDSLCLNILRSRLTCFPRKEGFASNPRLSVSAVAEHMESEQTEYSPFLSLSPSRLLADEHGTDLFIFNLDDLRPSPEACDVISFGCGPFDDDVLSTAVFDFEELIGDLCGSLPPSGQKKHTSPSYNELLEVVTRAVDKLGLEWDSEPAQTHALSKLDDRYLTSRTPAQPAQPRKPVPFFQDFHHEVSKSWKQPFWRASQIPLPLISPLFLISWCLRLQLGSHNPCCHLNCLKSWIKEKA